MHNGVFDAWCDLLISDKYRWCRTFLRHEIITPEDKYIGHCVQGVLCELYIMNNGPDCSLEAKPYGYYSKRDKVLYEGVLPKEVREWAELDNDSPHIVTPVGNRYLTLMNDQDKMTLPEIGRFMKHYGAGAIS